MILTYDDVFEINVIILHDVVVVKVKLKWIKKELMILKNDFKFIRTNDCEYNKTRFETYNHLKIFFV